jgi:predicted nucleic acid-binding protein
MAEARRTAAHGAEATSALEFCDTNVLVYAFDQSAGEKRVAARALMDRLWASNSGVTSVQVLQECFVVLTRRLPHPLAVQTARAIVEDLSAWRVACRLGRAGRHRPRRTLAAIALGLDDRAGGAEGGRGDPVVRGPERRTGARRGDCAQSFPVADGQALVDLPLLCYNDAGPGRPPLRGRSPSGGTA